MHEESSSSPLQFNALKKEAKRVNNEHHHVGQASSKIRMALRASIPMGISSSTKNITTIVGTYFEKMNY